MCRPDDFPPYGYTNVTLEDYVDAVELCPICAHEVDGHDRRAEDGECFECNRTLGPCSAWMIGPDIRVGTEHEETPLHGESYCGVCGVVQAPTADRTYHPEAYLVAPA